MNSSFILVSLALFSTAGVLACGESARIQEEAVPAGVVQGEQGTELGITQEQRQGSIMRRDGVGVCAIKMWTTGGAFAFGCPLQSGLTNTSFRRTGYQYGYISDTYDYSDNYSKRCQDRAKEYANWCFPAGFDVVVVAEFSQRAVDGSISKVASSAGNLTARAFNNVHGTSWDY